jgi:uncharacterized protein (DUF2147 family)
MPRSRLTLIAVFLIAAAGAAADTLMDMKGRWRDSDAESEIEIATCGQALCGRIVWLKTDKADKANPDPALRQRPLIGVTVLRDFRPDSTGQTFKGRGYNPEDGQSYDAALTLKSRTSLVIRGCLMGGLVCDEDTWAKQP